MGKVIGLIAESAFAGFAILVIVGLGVGGALLLAAGVVELWSSEPGWVVAGVIAWVAVGALYGAVRWVEGE